MDLRRVNRVWHLEGGAREAIELEGTALSCRVPGPAPHRKTTDGSRVGITGEDLGNRAPHQEPRAR